jgi:hypothetical protein
MRKLIALTGVALVVASMAVAASPTAGASGGIVVTFDKHVVDSTALVFEGRPAARRRAGSSPDSCRDRSRSTARSGSSASTGS